MKREEAIKKVAQVELEQLSYDERAEQLEAMLFENWSDHPQWNTLPKKVQNEFDDGELKEDASSTRYNPVLLIWLSGNLVAVTNNYLIEKLYEKGENVDVITGSPVVLTPCPCCGYRTIGARGNFHICPVCWWEDDGQDNEDADLVSGGPNYISLTQARINYLKKGIFDPARKDLIEIKKPANRYEKGRVFDFSTETGIMSEPGKSWKTYFKIKEK
ncbi:MAG: hypothetical protein GY757_50755 [bacterium]|nr:hypothetical protein [bacterium]